MSQRSKTIRSAFFVVLSSLLIAGLFQNCARIGFDENALQKGLGVTATTFTCTEGDVDTCEVNGLQGTMTCLSLGDGTNEWGNCTAGNTPFASCTFQNLTYAHGQSFVAYSSQQVAANENCVSQLRTCVDGALSGSFLYQSCSQMNGSCQIGGNTIAHSQSIDAYKSASATYGTTCEKESRLCFNGNLSGSYAFLTCIQDPPANCTLSGQVIPHGDTVKAFSAASVAYGSTCNEENRSCVNGVLSGSYSALSCQVQPPANCEFNNKVVPHGADVTAYQKSLLAFGGNCSSVSEKRLCSNGQLSGSYPYDTCRVEAAKNCDFNGQVIVENQSVKAYQNSSVPFGSQCLSETRTCVAGVLSGSYGAASCSVQPPVSCSFNGQVIAHGAQVSAYSSISVPFGQSCSSVMQYRTCSNGALSGGANYSYSSCQVQAPKTCVFNGQNIAHGGSVAAYSTASVTEPATCSSQTRTCNDGNLSGSYAYPSCQVNALPQASCSVHYQIRNHRVVSNIASNGAWAKYHSDQNYNCRDNPGCGIRFGIACYGDAEMRLTYQYKEFSQASIEKTTPWSGGNSAIQWGEWSLLQRYNHPEAECAVPYRCGLKVVPEVQGGKYCSITYQYKTDKGNYSPLQSNGAWSDLSRSSNQGDNCDDSDCGIRAYLSCGTLGVTNPGGGSGGGRELINNEVNQVSNDGSAARNIASESTANNDGIWVTLKSWWASFLALFN